MKRPLSVLIAALLAGIGGSGALAQISNPAFAKVLDQLLSHSVPLISVQEAARRGDVVFLDAREKEEYEISHIAGALHVGYKSFQPHVVQQLSRARPIVVYCSVGYRSERIAEKLIQSGFTQVYNLHGGIFEWVNQQLPIVNAAGEKTQRVHAYDRVWGIWLQRGEKVY
ncbi:MAG: rhodanese-like domain-containing protein [Chitinophagales bacterium]|nr:rhodanese-like domain-containing protein [Chitinophagales bacterium]MDW8427694.1 rhodanese-like domain-containing protein [Chitinophagales bacterium]